MEPAIVTTELSKQYPTPAGWRRLIRRPLAPPAVDRVSLAVGAGELFGLLGPNGAGKTTLIKLLSTLIVPTGGSARVNGYDLHQEAALKASIGLATSDERSFYWRLTGRQNLEFFASLHGLSPDESRPRIQALLAQMGLEELADQRFLIYSTGNRQRLTIARALLSQPRLLFLDEPTKGLDPLATQQLHQLVRSLVDEQGLTVFLTTHDLSEAETLCDRIAIMGHGRIRACGTLAELRAALDLEEVYRIHTSRLPAETQAALQQRWPAVTLETGEAGDAWIELPARRGSPDLNTAVDLLRGAGCDLSAITHTPPSLETIFTRHILAPAGDPAAPSQPTPAVPPPLNRASPPASVPAAAPYKRWGLRSLLRVAGAFLLRDLRIESSYRFAFLMEFFGIVFNVGVFYFISRLFGPAAAPYLSAYGGDYFAFVLIGIAFLGYFGVGLSAFSTSLREAQTTGTLEAMLTSPTALSQIVLSSSLWQYLMTTIRVAVYLLGAVLLGVDLGRSNAPAALLVLLLTVLVFSSLGVLAASFTMVLKRGDPVTWLFGAVSSLLGGVYYPLGVLPAWMQTLAHLLPITYALEAMRKALLQGASFAALAPDLLALAVFGVVLMPLSLLAFRYAVRQARIEGSLTHY